MGSWLFSLRKTIGKVSTILVTLTPRSDSNFESSDVSLKEAKPDGVIPNSNDIDYYVRKNQGKIRWFSADCVDNVFLLFFFCSASIAGFLAALECDAEDVLKGLGFRDQSDSPVARIPRRFFFSPSSAKGIDPKDCYDSFIDDEEEVSPYSVELSCNAISEVLNKREIKFTKFVVDKCRYLFRYSMPNTSPTMTKVSELDRKTPVILPALSGTYVMVDKTDKRFVRFLMKVGRLNADARSTKSSRYSRG